VRWRKAAKYAQLEDEICNGTIETLTSRKGIELIRTSAVMWALSGASRANSCSLVPKNRRASGFRKSSVEA